MRSVRSRPVGESKARARIRLFERQRAAEPEKLTRSTSAGGMKQRWRPLGPSCIPHGQTYGEGPGSRPS